ncbi:MAG: hypothetical protein IBJ03_02065 [Gemmatimonadaceae bacterium]|nr:hypothetical protein [Gemmatimonadaceae bacterium]
MGIQLLRIPAGNGAAGEARMVPARLAQGELHLVTLSLNALRVRAPGAPGSGVVEFKAMGPIITAYQTPQASGVRTGW